jgi:hypothetical protein
LADTEDGVPPILRMRGVIIQLKLDLDATAERLRVVSVVSPMRPPRSFCEAGSRPRYLRDVADASGNVTRPVEQTYSRW